MADRQLQSLERGTARLSGELTFESVPSLVDAIDELLNGADTLALDLSGVSRSDSAGLALLVSWQRRACLKNKKIVFAGLPEQLLGLVQVSGVEKILTPGMSAGATNES